MKQITWNPVKSQRLKRARGVSFEEIINTRLVDICRHPEKSHQQIMIFEHKNYLWAVPFVYDGSQIFLKTIYPSRKLTKFYRQRKKL
ncbi:MAG TPA: toxin [Candidatus Omnitrophota bacterium]|nr:toxin [Candidatus Omnitrophota bacterium]